MSKSPTAVVLESYADLAALCSNSDTVVLVNGASTPKSDITGFSFGKNPVFATDHFLYQMSNLTTIEHEENLISCGNYAFGLCTKLNQELNFSNLMQTGESLLHHAISFNSPLVIPKVFTLGDAFMAGCGAFAQGFILPPHLKHIGKSVFQNMDNFTGPLYIPEGIALPSNEYTLSVQNRYSAAYTNGVTLTGPGAEAWKVALPDRATTPYRKLILG